MTLSLEGAACAKAQDKSEQDTRQGWGEGGSSLGSSMAEVGLHWGPFHLHSLSTLHHDPLFSPFPLNCSRIATGQALTRRDRGGWRRCLAPPPAGGAASSSAQHLPSPAASGGNSPVPYVCGSGRTANCCVPAPGHGGRPGIGDGQSQPPVPLARKMAPGQAHDPRPADHSPSVGFIYDH